MKKLVCSVLLCLSLATFGQTERGKFLILAGTNLSFSSLSHEYESDGNSADAGSSSQFDLTLGGGYFVHDNIALGIEVSYDRTSTEYSDGDKEVMSASAISPFVRAYIGSYTVARPFVQAGIGFGKHKGEYTSANYFSEGSEDLFLYSLSGGVSFFLNDIISLDILLAYVYSSLESDAGSSSKYIISGFGSNIGFSIFL